jgi:hypothetical protein
MKADRFTTFGQGVQKGRTRIGLLGLLLCPLLVCPQLTAPARAGVPAATNLRITDVATRSFAVTWHSSEPVNVSGGVFRNCSSAVTGVAVSFDNHSSNSGNIRVTISGLSASTAYCYKPLISSLSTGEQGTLPDTAVSTAAQVTRGMVTGSGVVPFANDLVRVPDIYLAPGEAGAGVLVTLELANGGGLSPLSLMVSGDQTRNYFNLNNLFANDSRQSLNLTGGERVRLTERHGTTGCLIERFRTVPADTEITAARDLSRGNPKDIDASGGVNILDLLRVVGGKGSLATGPCFNSDLDVNGDGKVDIDDFNAIKSGFNGAP